MNGDDISKSYSQLAREAGINPAVVHSRLRLGWSLEDALSKPVRKRGYTGKVVYPNILKWLDDHDMTFLDFAIETGLGDNAAANVIYGRHDPQKHVIDKILELTGMTYEEAFRKE